MIHCVDFETEGIEAYPNYPPKPVGVSVWAVAQEKPRYFAWGHPTGNNCTFEEAQAVLRMIWDQPILFHNGRFDTEVARVHMGLPAKMWHDVEDTLFLNYLYDPNAESLSLKPSSERILGLPPDEKNNLDRWLLDHGFKPGRDICKAPADLVEPYANGDTFRTRRLYEHLLPIITQRGMLDAYRREQKLAPILNLNEADGIRVDSALLLHDLDEAEAVMLICNKRLGDLIGTCNFDSSAELAAMLVKSGRCKEDDFLRTPTGKLATNKKSMDGAVKDPELRALLGYRSNLKTILTTFMRPWVELAVNGRLHPSFNQVRGDIYGTRTGRLSSSNPNFQNIPTEFKGSPPADLPALPFMRRYILPDEGHVLVSSDFNGQEMRITAHFAEGRAAEIYRNDPRADFHAAVARIIEEDAGLVLDRKLVKITGFSLLYGSGINSLSELLGVDKGTAANIRKHYFQALPGFQELMDDVSARGRAGLPVKTWGGRLLHAEKGKLVNGQNWTFEYKLLNYLVQGSAADQTKEAINTVGYWSKYCRFLATVHDENVYSIDPRELDSEIECIKSSMEDQDGWDVPFKAEVKTGINWWDLQKYAGGAGA
jgi:DNA polymerase I-like protein with 3'-5' exonuclease and polymerase domains